MLQETSQVVQLTTPFLIAAVGYLLSRTVSRLDADIQKIPELADKISDMTNDFTKFKERLEIALIAARKVEELSEKVAVLQRDQTTAWKHIDELKEDMKKMHQDFAAFGSLIGEFRRNMNTIKRM